MSKVYLLGAGPGDPGLLTLRAKEILGRADVVVYDYLANKVFLDFCRSDAELIYVGKKGGEHTLTQEKINELLVQKAGQGQTVARLKGGDPYVFGRGAEEAEQLLEDGVSFEVVPGVTSAVAAPAYAGIPLTHRKYASSVSFITGHEDPDKPESVHNWEALAKGTSTLVFFMGVKNLAHITSNLIKAKMAEHKPAALIRWGTTCEQKTLVGTLGTITEIAEQAGMKPPALLVLGDVVGLRENLNWFEKRPLLGKGVVVTRAREQASALKHLLEEKGACCFQFPSIAIAPLKDYAPVKQVIANIKDYQWLVFTSVNGVKYFWNQLEELGLDTRALGKARVAAIGPATADKLREKGIAPDFIPQKYVAEHVVRGLLQKGIDKQQILIPRALKAREVLPEELRKAGAKVTVLPVYRTELAQESDADIAQALEQGRIDYITFTSSSTVENFFALLKPEKLTTYVQKGLQLACIGPITAQTLADFG